VDLCPKGGYLLLDHFLICASLLMMKMPLPYTTHTRQRHKDCEAEA
jgi:hypothetical protein